MKEYYIKAIETFMASQEVHFCVEAESEEEAIKKVSDFEVFPEFIGDIIPEMEGETVRTIIECENAKHLFY